LQCAAEAFAHAARLLFALRCQFEVVLFGHWGQYRQALRYAIRDVVG
jgi:hypothetical protein